MTAMIGYFEAREEYRASFFDEVPATKIRFGRFQWPCLSSLACVLPWDGYSDCGEGAVPGGNRRAVPFPLSVSAEGVGD
jgi:hypothetical protein